MVVKNMNPVTVKMVDNVVSDGGMMRVDFEYPTKGTKVRTVTGVEVQCVFARGEETFLFGVSVTGERRNWEHKLVQNMRYSAGD